MNIYDFHKVEKKKKKRSTKINQINWLLTGKK